VNKQEKQQRVDALREELAGQDGLLVAEYRGTSVSDVQALRTAVRAVEGQVRVVKNTLARLSIQGTALEAVSDKLVGPVLITYGADLAGAAKAIVTVAKNVPTLVLTGGVLSGKALAPAQVDALSKLPGKNQLRSMLLGTFNAVPTKLVGTMAGVPRGFLNVLTARKEKLEAAA
jgi:large subunit ribosomal protein L10